MIQGIACWGMGVRVLTCTYRHTASSCVPAACDGDCDGDCDRDPYGESRTPSLLALPPPATPRPPPVPVPPRTGMGADAPCPPPRPLHCCLLWHAAGTGQPTATCMVAGCTVTMGMTRASPATNVRVACRRLAPPGDLRSGEDSDLATTCMTSVMFLDMTCHPWGVLPWEDRDCSMSGCRAPLVAERPEAGQGGREGSSDAWLQD